MRIVFLWKWFNKYSSNLRGTNSKYSGVGVCFDVDPLNFKKRKNIYISDGAIYSCGSNNKGQLGIGHKKDANTLQFVSALSGVRIVKVSGGWDFSLALSGMRL